jgi:hypothetical protein
MPVPSARLIALSGVFIVAASFIPGKAQAQRSESPRNATVPVGGARVVRIDAEAGILRVEGRDGINEVRVRGTARVEGRGRLQDIKLIAERRGDEIYIKADIPENDTDGWREGSYMGLDLIIEVPRTMRLDVDDGSGEASFLNTGQLTLDDGSGTIEIRGMRGDLDIDDGSGEITIDGVNGSVRISDGSGEIDARNVTGDFTIADDGSGGIRVRDVGGTMRVGSDGSGNIDVDGIGGDFVVDSDGGGGIRYDTVKGRVSIPERMRRMRRG